MFYLVPVPKQFVDFSGVPYSGGLVTVYVHGTTDKAQIYAEADSSVLLHNPCHLDSNGAWKCFVPADTPLDYIVQDRDGNVVASYANIVMPMIDAAVTKGYVDSQDQLRDKNFAADHDPSQAYFIVGTYVIYEGRLYKSDIVIDEPEEWNADHWTECNVTDELNAKIAAEAQSRTLADSALLATISAETSRAQTAEAAAKTEVVQGENCTIEKTTAADGHDVYTVNADGKPQVQADWAQNDSSAVDYIKNKPNLGLKADKVQGATAGNLAALDANGNLTDSGSNASDFKTKQTPVADPSASGVGLEFIDSISQDANGEITPHKKSVQDGTTAQKGIVQLQDSIGSTESATDKAVTPHAVREAINAAVSSAYHAAGTKTVAQLTSSLLVAENEGCVYNVTDSGTTTSDFVDGAGHPINAGDNVGVCDVGGGVYKFDLLSGFVDLGNYLTKTGDASNTTSTFTKASGDTSTMTSGGKLSAIFTAISSFFASLKALAFKDKVSTGDISDDAITADKVKDNETLPVNISGHSANATDWSGQISGVANSVGTKRYVYIGRKQKSSYGCLIGMLTICSHTDSRDVYVIGSGWSNGNFGDGATVQRISSGGTDAPIKICLYNHEVTENGTTYSELWCYIPTTSGEADFAFRQLFNFNGQVTVSTGVVNRAESEFAGTLTKCANSDSRNIAFLPTNTAKGSTLVPVYVKASGEIDVCTDLSVTPDGTSTGYDLGISTTLKAFAQKFKNLVSSLKALAFKDKASYSDLSSGVQTSLGLADTAYQKPSGGIPDSDIASASTWNGKQDSLGISGSGDADKYLNQKGSFTMPTYLNTPRIDNSTDANTLTSTRTSRIVEEEATSTNHLPDNSNWWHLLSIQGNDGKYATQIALGMTTESVQYRRKDSNVWKSWNNMRDASWINSGTFSTDRIADDAITADKVKDNETLPVNISGSAGSVSYADSANGTTYKITGVELNSTGAAKPKKLETLKFYKDNSNGSILTLGNETGTAGTADRGILRLAAGNGHYSNLKFSNNLSDDYDTTIASPTPAGGRVIPVVASGGAGSPTNPVYVDSNGQVQPCTPSSMSVGSATNATNVNLSKVSNSTIGDTIKAGNGSSVLIDNAGNAYRWGGYRLSLGTFSIQDNTICIV